MLLCSNSTQKAIHGRMYIPMVISASCVKTMRVHIFNVALLPRTKLNFWQTFSVLFRKDHSIRKNMFAIPPRGVMSFWYQPVAYMAFIHIEPQSIPQKTLLEGWPYMWHQTLSHSSYFIYSIWLF